MKIFLKTGALALALAFVGSSCEKLDELTKLAIDTQLSEKTEIDIRDTGDVAYSVTQTFKSSSNEELNNYIDRLTTIEITTIQYKVANYTGADDGAFEGILKFAALPYEFQMPYTEVKDAMENDVVTTVRATEAQLKEISALFLDGQPVDVEFEGTGFNAPMKFSLEVILTVKAEAQIQE